MDSLICLNRNWFGVLNFSDPHEFPLISTAYHRPRQAVPFEKIGQLKNTGQWVHFYTHDRHFERLWKNPNRYFLDGHVTMIGAGLSVARLLPQLKGQSLAKVEKILTKNNFVVESNPKKPQPFGGKKWIHSDGSTVTVHPYGNGKVKEFKGGRNAHVHKEEPIDRNLNDRGVRDRNKDRIHIGIRNPADYKKVMHTPHGSGILKNSPKPVDPLKGKIPGGNLQPRAVGNTIGNAIRTPGRSGGGALGGGGPDIDEIIKGTPHSKKKSQ